MVARVGHEIGYLASSCVIGMLLARIARHGDIKEE
jgi:hypothetical protein